MGFVLLTVVALVLAIVWARKVHTLNTEAIFWSVCMNRNAGIFRTTNGCRPMKSRVTSYEINSDLNLLAHRSHPGQRRVIEFAQPYTPSIQWAGGESLRER